MLLVLVSLTVFCCVCNSDYAAVILCFNTFLSSCRYHSEMLVLLLFLLSMMCWKCFVVVDDDDVSFFTPLRVFLVHAQHKKSFRIAPFSLRETPKYIIITRPLFRQTPSTDNQSNGIKDFHITKQQQQQHNFITQQKNLIIRTSKSS